MVFTLCKRKDRLVQIFGGGSVQRRLALGLYLPGYVFERLRDSPYPLAAFGEQ